MGGGIAHAFLVSGYHVTVIESSEDASAAGRSRIESTLVNATSRGALDDPDVVLRRLLVSTDPTSLAACELVIEAVPEELALKRTIFQMVEKVAPTAWLATNTSSLSIDEVASAVSAPERLIGLHFFNPVPANDLVEIVVGSATDPRLVELAQNWVTDLGKVAVTVADSPGFASSRLGLVLSLEAMRMLEEGVASAEDIDAAMTIGYKHQAGPLRTTDIVGLDVRLAIAEHLAAQLGDRFTPPAILRDMVAAGRFGRKTGKGFYDWT
jgi:3-hydroxybutyryl-CoA dehydrogenase